MSFQSVMAADGGALDALFEKPAFASLGEDRLELFRQFAKDIDGKNPAEIIVRYVRLNSKMNKTRPLLQNEKDEIAEAIKESLSEDDRHKFNTVLKMI